MHVGVCKATDHLLLISLHHSHGSQLWLGLLWHLLPYSLSDDDLVTKDTLVGQVQCAATTCVGAVMW
jgi:hypothetical protein